jgi:hypothetical protein
MNNNVSDTAMTWIIIFLAAVIVLPFVFQFIKDVTSMHKVSPHQRYGEAIAKYYTTMITGRFLNSREIHLPSPWQPEYRNKPNIWRQSGWWQDQWRLYIVGAPSVYSGKVALPRPYDGCRDGNAPEIWFYDVGGKQTFVT